MARRRNAGKSLAQVWERQRELKLLANRVSGALDEQIQIAEGPASLAANCTTSVVMRTPCRSV